jgi:hypothetical protein
MNMVYYFMFRCDLLFCFLQVTEVFKHERQGCGIPSILLKQNIPELKGVSKDGLSGLVNALGYMLRGCEEHKVEASALINALGTCTEVTETTASIIANCWTTYSSSQAQETLNRVLNVGHLVGIDWKLGVALSSSSCNSLLAPFVTIVFHITDVNGNTVAEKVEFTYSEFQVRIYLCVCRVVVVVFYLFFVLSSVIHTTAVCVKNNE